MRKILLLLIALPLFVPGKSIIATGAATSSNIPAYLLGRFRDDYGITYTVTDKYFLQEPAWKYHIIKYDSAGQFFIAHNDRENDYEPGKYSRIDITMLTNMKPYEWAYCITTFDAASPAEAETKARADRNNLKKGCGGFPFSRMKRIK